MKTIDLVKKVISDRGWMAIRELNFDDGKFVRVLDTRGNIAYDTTNDVFYWVKAASLTDSDMYNKNFIITGEREYSYFFQVCQMRGDLLQDVLYPIFDTRENVMSGEFSKKPFLPVFKSTSMTGLKTIAVGKELPFIRENSNKNPINYKKGEFEDNGRFFKHDIVEEAMDLKDGTWITKQQVEEFENAQKKFHDYLKKLGVSGTLI